MQCPICFDDMTEGAVHTMSCGHGFHVSCIVQWAQSDHDAHGSCPVCRFTEDAEQRQVSNLSVDFGTRGAAQFARISRALDRAVPQLSDGERALLDVLRKEEQQAVVVAKRAREAHSAHLRAHGAAIKRARALERRMWSTRFRVSSMRRNIISLFPVTRVVIRDAREGRTVGVPRRSARLAAAASPRAPEPEPEPAAA